MISYSSLKTAYDATEPFKLGEKKLSPVFDYLSVWTLEHFQIRILNVEFYKTKNSTTPHLKLIVDKQSDWQKACAKNGLVKAEFRKFVVQTLKGLIHNSETERNYKIDAIKINVENFSDLAHHLAAYQLLKFRKVYLLQKLSPYNIYDIVRTAKYTVFIFYTEENLELSKGTGEQNIIKKIYCECLKEYDRFSYCRPNEPMKITFGGGLNWSKRTQSSSHDHPLVSHARQAIQPKLRSGKITRNR